MTGVSDAVRPYTEGYKDFESALARGAPPWLTALRREALARFTSGGFPGEREEDWKYTSTRSLQRRAFIPALAASSAAAVAIEPARLRETSACTLVFVDGRHAPALSTAESTINGLHVNTLAAALTHDAARLESYLVPEPGWSADPFIALNTAFLRDGVVIEVDAGIRLAQPLQLLFVSTRQAHPLACHPRILVRLGAGAHGVLVETYLGLEGAANLTNSHTQIALEDGACLEHLRLQRESPEGFHVGRVHVTQQHASRYLSHNLDLGGLWVRNDLHTRLQATEAETVFNGLYVVDAHRHVDNHTRIDHLAPHTRSDELYRGIVGGGRAVFNGKVVVAKHAIKTDASQSNDNLLLSRQAEIDTKPELEIYADDVKCSHGATIGQLDEQALFYLRSRGLDPETARGLLIGAFAVTVLDRISVPELRVFARRQLSHALASQIVIELS